MQGDQRAYDRGITTFSPDGRLYQVEYARQAIERGSQSVGVRTPEGVAFAVERAPRSPLEDTDSIRKLHHVDDHVGIATAGHVADGRRLVDLARRRAQAERIRYGEPVDVRTLTTALTDEIQEFTQTGGARPFGAGLLVGGVDDEGASLLETDPSGTATSWQANAIGRDAETIRDHLEEAYDPGMDLQDGTDLAVEALASVADLDPDGVGVATVDDGGYREHDHSARRARLDRLGLLDETAS